MLFGSNTLVGLDIGTSSIKLVEVETSKKNFTLKNFGYVPTPRGCINGGEIVAVDVLANAIRSLFDRTKTKSRKICTSIWGTAVITKKISIPRIEEKLLADQLKWEAEQYIPFDINDISLEYQVLRNSNNNPEQMSVLLVAAKRDYVLRYAEVIELAGLTCSVVDVTGFGLGNCFEANYGQFKDQTVIVLNVGAGTTNFIAIENGEVAFSRDIPIGGLSYSNEIQKTMAVSFEEAESLKVSAGTGQPVPNEVTESLVQTNEVVTDEIRRSLDFYLATTTDSTVQKIYVTGGCLGIPGLFDQLRATLNIPIEEMNPFNRIQYNQKKFTPEYITQISPYISVGLGLAMRGAR